MNVRHLEVLRAVIDAGSASRTAKALGLSQPAVSRSMKRLEVELGFNLFDRSHGRLSPTPAAMRLHGEVEKAFKGIEKVILTARDIGNISEGTLRIAMVPSLAYGLLSEVLGIFTKRMPSLTTNIEIRSQMSVTDIVASRGADIGATTLQVGHPGIVSELLCRPRTVCILPDGHSLAKHKVIRPPMFNGVDMIALNRRNKSRHEWDDIFLAAGVQPRIRAEVANAQIACSLAVEGVGIAIINSLVGRRYDGHGVVMRELEPSTAYDYCFIYPANQPRSEITQAFVAFVKQYLIRIGENLPNTQTEREPGK